MAKLAEILANKRDDYMISVLEESTSELESLKTKKYLTENLNLIGKVLMEEGVVDAAKANLANNWGKYAAGAGVVGAGTLAGEAIAHPEVAGQVVDYIQHPTSDFGTVSTPAGTATTDALQNAQNTISSGYHDAKNAIFGNPVMPEIDEKTKQLMNDVAPVPTTNPENVQPIPGLNADAQQLANKFK